MNDIKTETTIDKSEARPSGWFTRALQSPLTAAAVIAVVTLAVFAHVLTADFVMWDDDRMIYENPQLTGLSIEHLCWIFTHADVTRRYTPLAALNYSMTYQSCRLNPFGYHLSSWLFHGLNAAILFLVLRILLIHGLSLHGLISIKQRKITVAASLGALIWSLHPLRTEAVAWAGANFYPQATFFMLISLLYYLRANQVNIDSRSHLRRLLVSSVFFAAAILSHPIVIGYLAVLFVLDVYPLGKIRGWKSTEWHRVLLEKTPFAAAALAIALITVYIRLTEGGDFKPVSLDQFGITERLWQAIYIWAYYIWRPWYPVNLSPVYTILVTFKPFWVFILSAILLLVIIKLATSLRHRWPLGLTLVMCHLFLLIPVLGIFEHPHYPCDRYSLIASILWSVLLAAWISYPKIKTMPYAVSITLTSVVIVTLGVLTFQQTRVWTNSKTLFTHMIKMLGNDPYRSDIYWRLGIAYSIESNIDESVKYCAKAVEINPKNQKAQNALGILLIQKNNAEEALRHFNIALLVNPQDTSAYTNRVLALIMLGRFDEAMERLNTLLQQRPDSVEGNYLLSVLLTKTGKTSQTVTQLKKTIILAPNWADPLNNLARILAVSQNPSLRDPNEAIRLAKYGCELTEYQRADLLDTLAIAYASAGKFSEAVHYAEQALSLAKLPSEASLSEKIRSHLHLFQQGQACNE